MSAHPFRFRVGSPFGDVQVDVLPGRVACVSGAPAPEGPAVFPLSVRGQPFNLKARYARGTRGWQLRDLSIQASDPKGGPGHVEVALVLTPHLSRVLEGELRGFVERDLVEVHRERREDEEAIARVRSEIERRRAKMDGLARAAERAEPSRSARERLLRAELSALPGLASPDGEEAFVPGSGPSVA